MPSFNITGFSSSIQTLGNGQTGFIGVNGALVVDGDNAVTQSGFLSYLTVHGTLLATGISNIAVDMAGTNMRINVGSEGNITSNNVNAIFARPTTSNWIQNAGTIQGSTTTIDSQASDTGADIRLLNTGDILGNITSVRIGTGSQDANIVNSGTMIGGTADGINIASGDDIRVNNSGVISGGSQSYDSGGDSTRDHIKNS